LYQSVKGDDGPEPNGALEHGLCVFAKKELLAIERERERERGEGKEEKRGEKKHTKRLVRPLERELLHHAIDAFQLGEADGVLRVPRVAGGPDLDGEAVCELYIFGYYYYYYYY
jgi:hypothetical protein